MSAIASTLFSDQPMRVLSSKFGERLAHVTQAQRALKALGYHVSSQSLRMQTHDCAHLTLKAGDAQLRRRLAGAMIVARGETFLVSGRFHHDGAFVDVSWIHDTKGVLR